MLRRRPSEIRPDEIVCGFGIRPLLWSWIGELEKRKCVPPFQEKFVWLGARSPGYNRSYGETAANRQLAQTAIPVKEPAHQHVFPADRPISGNPNAGCLPYLTPGKSCVGVGFLLSTLRTTASEVQYPCRMPSIGDGYGLIRGGICNEMVSSIRCGIVVQTR
jgi:hypothetical protein